MHQWLLELGAQQLGVPIAQLTTKDGVVMVTNDPSKQVTYAKLAAEQAVGSPIRHADETEEPRATILSSGSASRGWMCRTR